MIFEKKNNTTKRLDWFEGKTENVCEERHIRNGCHFHIQEKRQQMIKAERIEWDD